MVETPDPRFEDAKLRPSGAAMTASETEAWFIQESMGLSPLSALGFRNGP
jgi:hypothetical protein